MEYLLTLIGFIILITSGNFLVKGSVSLASRFGISTLVTGVTIVAFGTSAPELLVSLQSALSGFPEMALGNVVGSNISNITLVLAITAVILPIRVQRNSVILDWPFMMLAGIVLLLAGVNGRIERWEGFIMNVLLLAFILLAIKRSGKSKNNDPEPEEAKKPAYNLTIAIIIILISCAGLAFGSRLLVDNTTLIAQSLGIPERAIAISMLAVGTSLPELATSVIAALQKETDISVGNIIGSNIFNIFSVLGIIAIINPVEMKGMIIYDVAIMLAIFIILLFMMLPPKRSVVTRWEGAILLALYIVYLIFVFK